jgi:Uncharacterized conserved protein
MTTSSRPEQKIEINEQLKNGSKYYLQNVSVDNVIFGYHIKELKVLLQRPKGITKWILPGGYISKTETIDDAAKRIAESRTNLKNLFLRQFKAFGTPQRVSNEENFKPEILGQLNEIYLEPNFWTFDYFVSIGFYTLTEFSKVKPSGEYYMEECKWWSIDEVPNLMFDHNDIIKEALKHLRMDIHHLPIGIELLPDKFTLPEIHALYETILGRKLDSRNFAKKLITTGIIGKLDEQRNIGAHRSPYLYNFNKEVYHYYLNSGGVLIF